MRESDTEAERMEAEEIADLRAQVAALTATVDGLLARRRALEAERDAAMDRLVGILGVIPPTPRDGIMVLERAYEDRRRHVRALTDERDAARRVLLALAGACDAAAEWADRTDGVDDARWYVASEIDALGHHAGWAASSAALRRVCGVSDAG